MSKKRVSSVAVSSPHSLESLVRRKLLAQAEFTFSSLVVHRIPNGVCLEGVLQSADCGADVSKTALGVDGVSEVQNHLLVCESVAH